MIKRKILILRGLQGSGKSTFAKQWVSESPETRVRFNRDDIRNMLGTYWVPSRESLIDSIYWETLSAATAAGYDIVVDNMNLNEKYIKEIEEFVEETNLWLDSSEVDFRYEVEVKEFFHVPLQTCIDRDAQRENPVGERVIRSTFNKYKSKISPWKYLT